MHIYSIWDEYKVNPKKAEGRGWCVHKSLKFLLSFRRYKDFLSQY